MTADEYAHMQDLEGLIKRYRSRIVELKVQLAALEKRLAPEPVRAYNVRAETGSVVTPPDSSCKAR